MAEETNPTSSPAPPASNIVDMENSPALTNSKAGNATVEENTPPVIEDKNTGEGMNSLCHAASVPNILSFTFLFSYQDQWRFT